MQHELDVMTFAREGAREQLRRIYATFPELAAETFQPAVTAAAASAVAEQQAAIINSNGTPRKQRQYKHWTQSPAGRKRMAQIQRARWRKAKVAANADRTR